MKDKYEELKQQISFLSDAAMSGRSDKEERFRKSYLYYSCLMPEKQGNEMSNYVEPVLRKVVDTIKPSLMNIFTENEKKAVQFRPLTRGMGIDMISSGAGVSIAEVIDDYINKTFIWENNGFDLLDRALTEVLVTGDAFVKYFIEEEETEKEFELERVPQETLDAILADFPDTDEDELKKVTRHKDGTISVDFKAERYDKKIRIEFIPFNDIFISGAYENIKDTRYICHRIYKTVGELLDMGYDEEKVTGSTKHWMQEDNLSTKKLVNFGIFGDEDLNPGTVIDPMERVIPVYEHYMYSSLVDKRKKKSKLYKVVTTDGEVLDCEEIDRIPFVHGKMEQVPGSFWARSMYDKTKDIQDLLSRLIRALEFNTADGAFGRYICIKGMYDRASLLNNRPGSVIEVNPEAGAAAVQRFEKEQLPPSIEGLIQRLTNTYKEDALSFTGIDVSGSGVSATAAAITAHSADLKDKVIARTLAYTLFRPLFEGIYDIIVSEDLVIGEIPNPQIQQAMDMGLPQETLAQIPQVLPIRGSELPPRADFIIDVNTSNDEAMLNTQLMNLMTLLAQLQPGMVNVQEVAAQFTGMPVEEVVKFFPLPPQPTEEQMAIQQMNDQLNMEVTQANVELVKGQVSKVAMEVVEMQEDMRRKAEEVSAQIARDEEESFRKLQVMRMRGAELEAEIGGQEIRISEYR